MGVTADKPKRGALFGTVAVGYGSGRDSGWIGFFSQNAWAVRHFGALLPGIAWISFQTRMTPLDHLRP